MHIPENQANSNFAPKTKQNKQTSKKEYIIWIWSNGWYFPKLSKVYYFWGLREKSESGFADKNAGDLLIVE